MRRVLFAAAAVATALAVVPAGAATTASTGSGAPSGAHYDLNVIGVENPKNTPMTGSNTHVIFTPLKGGCKINLSEGDFSVLDGNCTDGSTAGFQLPNPDPDGDGTTAYSVYARALGKPGGTSTTKTCFTDTTTGEFYCSVYEMVLVSDTGKSSFSNVSQELLYVYYCDTDTGKIVRDSLFSNDLYDYYWDYQNNGLRLAQMRFYPNQQTTVAPAGAAC